jgi:hypothetical protein
MTKPLLIKLDAKNDLYALSNSIILSLSLTSYFYVLIFSWDIMPNYAGFQLIDKVPKW